jgi:uncharacterized phage-associated protein
MAYEPRKAAQLIAYLIGKSRSNTLNLLKAVKLVYLVDRESISRYGFPVLDEPRFSMPHGPVNSTTLDHINGFYDLSPHDWADFLTDRENNVIGLSREQISREDLDELSDADIECADEVWNRFGTMDQWRLRDWTHDPENIPEWRDPNGGREPITLLEIMRALNLENAEEMSELAASLKSVDNAFQAARVRDW